jgi:ABC-type Mn2+/Zn2+ transport system permease subunit
MDANFLFILLTGIFVGGSAGYLGSLMVLRRMSLVGDAFSHVALPGVGLALLFKINPFIGAFLALFFGVILIWSIQHKSKLPAETIVGIIFASSLALGAFIVPEHELVEALFGDISKVTFGDFLLALILSVLIFFITKKIF